MKITYVLGGVINKKYNTEILITFLTEFLPKKIKIKKKQKQSQMNVNKLTFKITAEKSFR